MRNLFTSPAWGRVKGEYQIEQRRLTYFVGITTTAGGLAFFQVNSALLRSSSAEWASYAARFTEYRILGLKIHVMTSPGGTLATNQGFCIIAQDQSGTLATPTTTAAMWGLADSRVWNLDDTLPRGIVYTAKAVDLEDLNYTAVTTSSTTFQVFVHITGLASTQIASAFLEWCVEFKSPQ